MKKLQLPFGVQDYMPQECYQKNLVQERLATVFLRHGFRRVDTPAIEYFDVYDEVLGRNTVNKTFKMTDSDGSLLMLRFDPTLQICRMAATKLGAEQIEKVFYIANSYEYIPDSGTARSREFAQTGVELLGSCGSAGDTEAIVVAIESLLGAGLTDFLLEIGQVDYFNGIVCEAGMCDEDAKELRVLINKKDMLGVEMFLRGKNVNEKFMTQFLQLPTLFGDEDVLARAREGVANQRSLRALDNLQQVYAALRAMRLDKYVSVDLGLLRGEYYTGLVLKGITRNLGVPILDGGRYDALCASFGKPMPAIGFSIGVKRLLVALEKEGKLSHGGDVDCAYISDGKDVGFEYSYVREMRSRGLSVEKRFGGDKKALVAYCRHCGIRSAIVIEGNKATEIEVTR